MFDLDDKKAFGKRLVELRQQRYKESPDKFPYCKNQASFCQEISSLDKEGKAFRRQTLGCWENGASYPTVQRILILCKLLECDPDFLLGYGKTVSKDIEFISDFTGLERRSIEALKTNTDFIPFLNYILTSNDFMKLVSYIEKEATCFYVDKDLTSHYKSVLLRRMKAAFDRSLALSTPFDHFPAIYKRELSQELSGFRKNGIENGILIHISESIRNEILRAKGEREIPDESDEYYSLVIDFLAEFSCDPFSYEKECAQRKGRFAQIFIELLDDYFVIRTNQRRERMREYAKQRQQV